MKKFAYLLGIILLAAFVPLIETNTADAVTSSTGSEIPFGGMLLYTLDEAVCDCGQNSHTILDYVTGSEINLYKAPQSIFYEYFDPDYGTYQEGSYSEPSSEPECQMYIYYECETIQTNIGDYGSTPGTGTSR